MVFVKGQPKPPGAGVGVKGRSGRKKDPRGATRYFNELYDRNAFRLAEITIEKALAGDREVLIYCHDRRLGKPKIQAEVINKGEIGIGLLPSLMEILAEGRKRLETPVIEGEYKEIKEVHEDATE